jgi:hypothetical protein
VALADLTSVLQYLTSVLQELPDRKRFVDKAENGVNHPNDYGHRRAGDSRDAGRSPHVPLRREEGRTTTLNEPCSPGFEYHEYHEER